MTAGRQGARGLALALVVAAAAVVSGCGSPSADLFVVTRTGAIPGAKLSLLVNDGGSVRCNGGPSKDITSDDLILARKIARELNGKDADHPGPATSDLVLPPRPGSILRYAVRLEKGTVTFSDNSKGQPPTSYAAAAFTRAMAQRVCGLVR